MTQPSDPVVTGTADEIEQWLTRVEAKCHPSLDGYAWDEPLTFDEVKAIIAALRSVRAEVATLTATIERVEALRDKRQRFGPGLIAIGELDAALMTPEADNK